MLSVNNQEKEVKSMTAVIRDYLQHDDEKIEKLIAEYPKTCPVNIVAQFLEVDAESIRSAIDNGNFGFSWKKNGKLNRAFCVPTAHFLRWYLNYGN